MSETMYGMAWCFYLSKETSETPKHGSFSTGWLDVKAKPLATLNK